MPNRYAHQLSRRPRRAAVRLAALACAVTCLGLPQAAGAASRPVAPRVAAATNAAALLAGTKELNYYPAQNGWSAMWTNWMPAAIDADFARIAALHANTVRVIVQAGTFGYPTPQPVMLQRLAQMIALAATHGLRVHLTLFDWWNAYGDIAGSKQWAQAVIGPYTGDPRVAIIELQNEIDPANATAMAWARQMLPYLQQHAGGIPVTLSVAGSAGVSGLAALAAALQPARPDFYDFHYYPGCEVGNAYATLRQAQQAITPAPLFIGETGFSTDSSVAGTCGLSSAPAALEAYQDYTLRAVGSAAQALGLPAPAPWTLSDFTPTGIPAGTTANTSSQYHFGLYRTDGTATPAATSVAMLFGGASDLSFDNGFETGLGAGTPSLPADWRLFHATQAQFARDTTVAHTGTASARISASSGDSEGVPAFYLSPTNTRIIPGQTYTASVWVRGLNATGGTRLGAGLVLRLRRLPGPGRIALAAHGDNPLDEANRQRRRPGRSLLRADPPQVGIQLRHGLVRRRLVSVISPRLIGRAPVLLLCRPVKMTAGQR